MRKNPELTAVMASNILGARARHGFDPKAPELVTEAVDAAEAIIAEVEKRTADEVPDAASTPPGGAAGGASKPT